jgi:DNA-directed RNA polymerase I, II, and III subunit RPABC2
MAEKLIESDIEDSDDDSSSSSSSSSLILNDNGEENDDVSSVDNDSDEDVFDDDDDGDDAENNNNNENGDSQVMDFSDEDDYEDEDDDYDDKNHLQKFNETLKRNVITEYHPELVIQNYHEVEELCFVIRNEDGTINDPRHRTVPFITKYEKARILGERAKQINAGATPFVDVNQEIIDGYSIALEEFEQKKVPMIIRRPLPNGQSEYWKLEDLEIL